MNTEPPYAGLKWAHYLRVMLSVPLDQGTQGNKGRIGIGLDDDDNNNDDGGGGDDDDDDLPSQKSSPYMDQAYWILSETE